MIALDTNVLVRFLVEDDPAQTEQAKAILKKIVDSGSACFIPDIVLCELVWVLRSSYRVSKPEVVERLRALSLANHLILQSTDLVTEAIDAYASGKGDFSDYLIRGIAQSAGAEIVATFDRALHQDSGFMDAAK